MMTRAFLIHVVLVCYLNIFFEISATEDDSVCKPGQYGRECRYNCSSFCNFDKCTISHNKGVPECNTGCNKYRTGFFCQEFCPNMCLECNQTDGTCHKCIDGYYGVTCNQTCPRNCLNGTCHVIDGSCILKPYAGTNNTRLKRAIREKLCRKMTEDGGVCQCCKTGRRGDRCEQVCQNCQTYYVPYKTCQYQCKAGYYGNKCDKECPERCQPGNSGKPLCEIRSEGLRCMNGCYPGYTGFQCNDTCSGNCKGTCYQTDGKCVDCPNGKYGDMCNKNCSVGCKKNICRNEDGSCQEGCKIGFYRDNCTGICGIICADSKCEDGANPDTTFLCSEGCKNGYRGRACDEACPKHCLICEQLSAEGCVQCNDGFNLENGPVQSPCKAIPVVTNQTFTFTLSVTLAITIALAFIIFALKRRNHQLTSRKSGTEDSTQVNNEKQMPLMEKGGTMEQEPLMQNKGITVQVPLMKNEECNDQDKDRLMPACRTDNNNTVLHVARDINPKGRSLLMNAAFNGWRRIFDILWNQPECDKFAKNDNNDTILHVACYNDNAEFLSYLLSLRVFDIECKGCKGRTPAMIAAQNGCRKVFGLLVTEGCDLTVTDEKRHDILSLACSTNNSEFVKYLFTLDRFIKTMKGNKGRTPLPFEATKSCSFASLVEKGDDL